MKKPVICTVCLAEQSTGVKVDTSKSKTQWARDLGVDESSIRRHLKHPPRTSAISEVTATSEIREEDEKGKRYEAPGDRTPNLDDWRAWIESTGDNPDDYIPGIRSTKRTDGTYWNQLKASRKTPASGAISDPLWPVIQPAATVNVHVEPRDTLTPLEGCKLSLKCADTQIGFRQHSDGTLDPFHDQQAMDLFTEVAAYHQPDSIVILGDFLDLASQGKFAQEAAFANTTQLALNAAHTWLATLRAACPDTIIIIIEGNHDARMQRFIEANALAAFGLKQANLPESWPVMSLPNLLRLDDLEIQYVDAYPAATYWDNAQTRNIHGTKVNSRGSTTSQYSNELPHINTWAGHTHRAEITYKTVLGEYGQAIESYAANPGVLCRVDGSVPSVNGAQHSDGTTARVVENWQQGFGTLYYNDTESIPQVYRIKDGKTMIAGSVFSV